MQDLLYIQTNSTSLDAGLLGMTLVVDGQIVDVAEDPVRLALSDGSRGDPGWMARRPIPKSGITDGRIAHLWSRLRIHPRENQAVGLA